VAGQRITWVFIVLDLKRGVTATLLGNHNYPAAERGQGGKAMAKQTDHFEFDWKATPEEVVAELSQALVKYALTLKPVKGQYLDSYYFRLQKN